MAALPNADPRRLLPLSSSPPLPSPKDFQGTDGSIPLSPQWLLSKPGDNRPGILTRDPHFSVSPISSDRQEALTGLGTGEEVHDSVKKKDVFRPSAFHDRWRDEERDSSSAVRKDRWRGNIDKEIGGDVFRKMDRWNENSSTKHISELQRAPSDRWVDTGSKENSYDQRRESKWSTRWGPHDKESEAVKESKWSNFGKDNDGLREKGSAHFVNHSKENDKETDTYYRPWKSSFSQGRGRGGEISHQQPLMVNMQSPTSGYNKVGGEKAVSTFSVGRGRGNFGALATNHHNPIGTVVDKWAGAEGNYSTVKYSRTKLLDIYRVIDFKANKKLLDGFVEVSALTQADPLEPVAFSAPSPDEMSILRAIDKGDIISSGAAQVSKDNSIGRSSEVRRSKYGSRELSFTLEDNKDEGVSNSKSDNVGQYGSPVNDKFMASHRSNSIGQGLPMLQDNKLNVEGSHADANIGFSYDKGTDGDSVNQVILQEKSFGQTSSSGKIISSGDQLCDLSNNDWNDTSPPDAKSKATRMRLENQFLLSSPYIIGESNSHIAEDFPGGHPQNSNCNNQFSDTPNLKSLLKPAPEDLYYYYKDPQGEIQGPFSGTDLVGWFEAGYFGLDLHVRVAAASADTPFCVLGDAMPHLKVKARPPPGFNEPKQNDYNLDASVRAKITTGTSILPSGVDEIERAMREHMQRHGSMTDAEKRFLESLMSGGNISNPQLDSHSLSEGLHQSAGNSREVIPIAGLDSGVDVAYLLEQKLSIERQMSLSNSCGYWPGRESTSVASKADVVAESPTLHSRILPHTGDTSHQVFKPQNVELRTMLQATGDKSSQAVNNEVPTWSNFSDIRSMSASMLSDGNNVPGGYMNALENKAEINPHDLQFASLNGSQFPQQRYQEQLSSTPLLMNQQPVMELSTGKLPLDNMLPSVPQEPHILNLSRYSQQSVPSHTSILDGLFKQPLHVQQQKELLLQQQQHLQQQQQQLQQQQQQQHLLFQMLAQSHLHFGEPSHMAVRSSSLDHHGLHHQVSEPVHLSSRFPHNFQLSGEDFSSEQFPQLPSAVANTAGLEGVPLKMPNQIFGSTELSGSWSAVHFSQKSNDIQQTHPISIPAEGGILCTEPLSLSVHHVLSDHLGSSQEGNEAIKKVVETPSEAVSEVAQSITVTKATDYSTSAKVCSTSSCLGDSCEDLSLQKEQDHVDMLAIKDVITDVKKVSDKKSRKQKKTSSSERGKGTTAGLNASKQLKPKNEESVDVRPKSVDGGSHEVYSELLSDFKTGSEITANSEASPNALHIHTLGDLEKSDGAKFGLGEYESVAKSNLEAANHRAWKPASGVKPKSLLEIQQEEQRRAQAEVAAMESVTSVGHLLPAFPSWTGILANAEVKSGRDIVPDDELVNSTSAINPRSKKSQLHDLLAEEVLAKTEENVQDASSMVSLPDSAGQMNIPLAPGNDFIEAKDLRKSRKKALKGKIAGSKMSSSPVFSFDMPAGTTLGKVKNSRQSQPENESQSVPPSGPLLGDFVIWKGGDQANVSPAPAWSTNSAKISKPVSLRDIQREQEKTMKNPRQQVSISVPPPKTQSNRTTGSGGTSWSLTGSSPLEAAVSPIKVAAQSKTKVEDDLFWGPINHSKEECKQADFPALANTSSTGWKVASTKGAIPRQKSIGGGSKSVENAVSSSPASSLSSSRRKRDSATIHSEAMGFKDWCENECLRLTGTKDTSILEYCSKQPSLEAKTVLIDNIGSLDPDHVFIDKFLNYKELLSAEVIETAFQEHGDGNPPGMYGADSHAGSRGNQDYDQDVVADGFQKGGKKKGKKGKKMSSAVLGFNVVSNRIMMGEIQTIED